MMRSLCVLLLAGCAYVDATPLPYAGIPRFAPSDPATIKVIEVEPRERYDRLGEVIVYASRDPAPKMGDIEKRLREEAAKWGANAVYIVRDIIPPGASERQLVGIAIRYR